MYFNMQFAAKLRYIIYIPKKQTETSKQNKDNNNNSADGS